jgi:hypothetical protein
MVSQVSSYLKIFQPEHFMQASSCACVLHALPITFFSPVVGSEFSINHPVLTHIPFIVCSSPKITEEVDVGVIF